jgi:hypothetical protein
MDFIPKLPTLEITPDFYNWIISQPLEYLTDQAGIHFDCQGFEFDNIEEREGLLEDFVNSVVDVLVDFEKHVNSGVAFLHLTEMEDLSDSDEEIYQAVLVENFIKFLELKHRASKLQIG